VILFVFLLRVRVIFFFIVLIFAFLLLLFFFLLLVVPRLTGTSTLYLCKLPPDLLYPHLPQLLIGVLLAAHELKVTPLTSRYEY